MKRKLIIPILFSVMLMGALGLCACGSSDDASGGGATGTYTLGGIIVDANSVNEYFVDPNDMSYSEQNAFKQKISDYGNTITVKDKSIDFDGLILAQYNSAKYSMQGRNIIFSNLGLKVEFTYATLENGVLSLCYTKDLITPIVFEYYSSDYVAPSYKITFDYGDNSDENWIAEKEVRFNEAIGELPTPQVEGYTFSGWTFGYNAITEETKFKWKKDIILNAVLSANTYKVTYEYNGATSGNYYQESEVRYNSTLYRLPTPSKIGYIFGGWFTEQNGSGQEIKYDTVWTIADNATLFAKWVSNEFVITFDYQGTQGNQETQTVYYNTEIGELPQPAKAGGNTFGGWFTEVGGGGVEYTVETIFTQTKNVTLYAKWNTSVTFNYDGATSDNTTESLAVVYNSQITEMPRPYKDGYSFDGWFYDNLEYRAGTTFSASGAIVLKAKWIDGTDKDNFTYTQSNSGITITGFSEKGENLTTVSIPAQIDSKPTISIASNSFSKKSSLQQISLPNSLLKIGTFAFEGTNISIVVIPESVTEIGNGAFLGCPLTEITIPFVGHSAMNTDSYSYRSFGYIFGKYSNTSEGTTSQSNGSTTNSYLIPTTLTKVTVTRADGLRAYGFYNCTMLTEIVINSEITTIPSYAFYACENLETLTSLANVEKVNSYAFYDCRKLNAVNDIKPLKYVGSYAFVRAPLNAVTFTNDITTIGTYAFVDNNISTVVIPESVTEIGNGAFLGCPLIEITIPFVGYSAMNTDSYSYRSFGYIFGKYSNSSEGTTSQSNGSTTNSYLIPQTLTKVTVTRADGLRPYGFYNCTMLTEIVINSEITTIPSYTFYACENLETLTGISKVNSVGSSSFYNCKKLNAVNDIQPLRTVGSYAFSRTPLNVITFEDGIKTIGEYAFMTTNISTVVIPESVTEIGSGAFLGCPLTEITIPFVGYSATNTDSYSYRSFGYIFGKYSNTSEGTTSQSNGSTTNSYLIPQTLTKVTVTRADGLRPYGFYNCTMLTEIVINPETKTIPERAFYNCGIVSFTIPDGVTTIARGAFKDCQYLETFGVPLMGTYNANNYSYLNYLFGGTEYNSINYVPSQLKTVIVTGNATTISPYALYNCANLHFITIDHEIASIGQQAFKGCASLKAITLNSSVPTLGNDALMDTPDDMILRVLDENKADYLAKWGMDESRIYGQNKSYVLFESRGGSAVDALFVDNGNMIVEPSVPRRSNYIFLGWYSDIKLQNKFDFNTPIDGDITLYAKWKYESIALDTEVTIDMNTYAGETYYFTFKPETSGYFTIRSYGTLDTTGILYNSSGSQITSNINGGTGISPNFSIRYQLTAGTTYIIGVKLTSATATGEFSIMISNG